MLNLKKIITKYLKEAKLMQIATSKNNKPWVATVWYVQDEKLNLYFISRRSRRHSSELKDNRNVAGAIVKPHTKGSGEKVVGLQFEGTSHDLTDEPNEIKKADRLYHKKYSLAEHISLKQLTDPKWVATYYVVHPKVFVLWDEINFPDNPRQEFKL
ncbi:MAG: pyridoxamine 5'-phosphate oxidase family protein [Candidatus Aenigmarchaeota archaeon]|nr:pyridoxamine 5'-phosphate oxidase family protein [Candidatus Aenigmarchaeota archaeon]